MRQAHEVSKFHKMVTLYANKAWEQYDDAVLKNAFPVFWPYHSAFIKSGNDDMPYISGDPVFLVPEVEEEYEKNRLDFLFIEENDIFHLPFGSFWMEIPSPRGHILYSHVKEENGELIFSIVIMGKDICLRIGVWHYVVGTNRHYFEGHGEKAEEIKKYAVGMVELCKNQLGKLLIGLQTKGMEQQIIPANEKLNKSREKAGKKPISDIIVIRPTHYYDRSGEKHILSGRTVKLHWRRGHTRGVWCGVGEERHLEKRYIRPCLVNFNPNDDTPSHKLRVLQ